MSAGTVAVADLVDAMRQQQIRGTALAHLEPSDQAAALELTVAGAHPGAGTSTVAVALAEARSRRGGDPVTVVDLTPGGGGGASEAIEVKADVERGWLGGRRGQIRIVRAGAAFDQRDPLSGALVYDQAGELWGDLITDVLVCRGTVPSIRKAELLLDRTRPMVVAVLGVSKWPSVVRSALGPLLREATNSGGVVFFPHVRNLEICGLTAEPLPESMLRSAVRLLEFIEYWKPTEAGGEQSGSS